MRRLLIGTALALTALLATAAGGRADADSATHYYVSLGDSLAASVQPNGDFTHGYAEQLHGALAATDPKLALVKLGCSGESSASLRFGSRPATEVLSLQAHDSAPPWRSRSPRPPPRRGSCRSAGPSTRSTTGRRRSGSSA
jgi:hypothetical protein